MHPAGDHQPGQQRQYGCDPTVPVIDHGHEQESASRRTDHVADHVVSALEVGNLVENQFDRDQREEDEHPGRGRDHVERPVKGDRIGDPVAHRQREDRQEGIQPSRRREHDPGNDAVQSGEPLNVPT